MLFKNTRFRKWLKTTPAYPIWRSIVGLCGPNSEIAKNIKRNIYTHITPIETTMIVASYGRSGSTMLFNNLIDSATNKRVPKWLKAGAKGKGRDLDTIKIKPGLIYPTHHYPPKRTLPEKARVIYIFADPVEVILSLLHLVHTGKWSQETFLNHCKNLQVSFQDIKSVDELVYEDKLNLEKHFDAWLAESRFPIAFVKYEHLWEHEENISSFVGFNVSLPPRKERSEKKVNDATMAQLRETYDSLRRKVNDCEDFFIKNT